MKLSKRYASYKSQANVSKLVLNIPPNCPRKSTFGLFDVFSFPFLTIFFENFKFIIIPTEKAKKNSIIWKKRNHRAKRSEILESRVVVQNIYGTFGLVVFQVILGVFRCTCDFAENTISKKATSSTNRSRNLSNVS